MSSQDLLSNNFLLQLLAALMQQQQQQQQQQLQQKQLLQQHQQLNLIQQHQQDQQHLNEIQSATPVSALPNIQPCDLNLHILAQQQQQQQQQQRQQQDQLHLQHQQQLQQKQQEQQQRDLSFRLLESLYAMNQEPGDDAIELIAQRLNSTSYDVANWFQIRREAGRRNLLLTSPPPPPPPQPPSSLQSLSQASFVNNQNHLHPHHLLLSGANNINLGGHLNHHHHHQATGGELTTTVNNNNNTPLTRQPLNTLSPLTTSSSLTLNTNKFNSNASTTPNITATINCNNNNNKNNKITASNNNYMNSNTTATSSPSSPQSSPLAPPSSATGNHHNPTPGLNCPSSSLLAKLNAVTSRPDAHLIARELDIKMIDLLEAFYAINDNPEPAAIEMIARRINVNIDKIADWFDKKRLKLNPFAGPRSPPAKKREGGRVVTFSEYQRSLLEAIFDENNYLHPQEYEELSNLIQVPSRNIKIWFKNRRSKQRLSGRIITSPCKANNNPDDL